MVQKDEGKLGAHALLCVLVVALYAWVRWFSLHAPRLCAESQTQEGKAHDPAQR